MEAAPTNDVASIFHRNDKCHWAFRVRSVDSGRRRWVWPGRRQEGKLVTLTVVEEDVESRTYEANMAQSKGQQRKVTQSPRMGQT